jgi:hypothetical protein
MPLPQTESTKFGKSFLDYKTTKEKFFEDKTRTKPTLMLETPTTSKFFYNNFLLPTIAYLLNKVANHEASPVR